MATDKKLSQLAAATSLSLTDLFYVVAGGLSRKITFETLQALLNGHGVAWTAPTLLNSWANIGGTEQVAQFRKVCSRVDVRMAVQNGNASPIFTLPTGYRPSLVQSFVGQVHDNTNAPDYCHIRVEQDGDVMLEHPVSLNNHKVWAKFSFYLD
jgi:hypothetical protein